MLVFRILQQIGQPSHRWAATCNPRADLTPPINTRQAACCGCSMDVSLSPRRPWKRKNTLHVASKYQCVSCACNNLNPALLQAWTHCCCQITITAQRKKPNRQVIDPIELCKHSPHGFPRAETLFLSTHRLEATAIYTFDPQKQSDDFCGLVYHCVGNCLFLLGAPVLGNKWVPYIMH